MIKEPKQKRVRYRNKENDTQIYRERDIQTEKQTEKETTRDT